MAGQLKNFAPAPLLDSYLTPMFGTDQLQSTTNTSSTVVLKSRKHMMLLRDPRAMGAREEGGRGHTTSQIELTGSFGPTPVLRVASFTRSTTASTWVRIKHYHDTGNHIANTNAVLVVNGLQGNTHGQPAPPLSYIPLRSLFSNVPANP
ncbi:MAG: hypothetical protein M1839_008318 [Geoglossum umbratile]|nr:MAG: hypothetical protein M1839_008318 [Geoglossum umbratile]